MKLSDISNMHSPDFIINKNGRLFITASRYEVLKQKTLSSLNCISETPYSVNSIKPPPKLFIKGIVNFPDLCVALIKLIGVAKFFCKSFSLIQSKNTIRSWVLQSNDTLSKRSNSPTLHFPVNPPWEYYYSVAELRHRLFMKIKIYNYIK